MNNKNKKDKSKQNTFIYKIKKFIKERKASDEQLVDCIDLGSIILGLIIILILK